MGAHHSDGANTATAETFDKAAQYAPPRMEKLPKPQHLKSPAAKTPRTANTPAN
jgi:hypothetical protein